MMRRKWRMPRPRGSGRNPQRNTHPGVRRAGDRASRPIRPGPAVGKLGPSRDAWVAPQRHNGGDITRAGKGVKAALREGLEVAPAASTGLDTVRRPRSPLAEAGPIATIPAARPRQGTPGKHHPPAESTGTAMTTSRHAPRKRPRRHPLPRRPGPHRPPGPAALGPLRPRRRPRAPSRPPTSPRRPPSLWRYRELLPLPFEVEPVTLGEGMTPLLPCPRLGRGAGPGATVDQGRVAAADGQLQEPRHDRRRQHGEAARPEAPGHPDGGQRRRRAGGLRRAGRHGGVRLHAGRHAGHQPDRGAPRRRPRLPRQRPHHRLRPARPRGRAGDGLVRHVHAQGAVPPRRQEDDGPGAGRAVRLVAARRDPLPDRRRHRPDRHVEGVRRSCASWAGCATDAAAAPDQLPERRLRPDRAGVRGGAAVRRAVPERAHDRQRPARAGGGRRLHDARRHPRQRRLRRDGPRRAHRRVDEARRRASRACRCAPRRPSASTAWRRCVADGTGAAATRTSWCSTPGRRRSTRRSCRSTCRGWT